MSKYEVVESTFNESTGNYIKRISVSPEEAIFLKFTYEPIPERIDAEVDIFLKTRESERLQQEIADLRRMTIDMDQETNVLITPKEAEKEILAA